MYLKISPEKSNRKNINRFDWPIDPNGCVEWYNLQVKKYNEYSEKIDQHFQFAGFQVSDIIDALKKASSPPNWIMLFPVIILPESNENQSPFSLVACFMDNDGKIINDKENECLFLLANYFKPPNFINFKTTHTIKYDGAPSITLETGEKIDVTEETLSYTSTEIGLMELTHETFPLQNRYFYRWNPEFLFLNSAKAKKPIHQIEGLRIRIDELKNTFFDLNPKYIGFNSIFLNCCYKDSKVTKDFKEYTGILHTFLTLPITEDDKVLPCSSMKNFVRFISDGWPPTYRKWNLQ